jgi:hypothetical protein
MTMLRCLIFLFVALRSGQRALSFTPSHIINALRSTSGPSSKSPLYLGDFFNFGKPKEGSSGTDANSGATTATDSEEENEGYYDEDDPVEKIFGFFFGKKEQAPLGYVWSLGHQHSD